jgi:hypothetical protein
LQIINRQQTGIPEDKASSCLPSIVPEPTDDVVINIETVDAELAVAGAAVTAIDGSKQDIAGKIIKADNPVKFMDSLLSTLESLAKFNAVVDEIAMVINYAMH